MVVGRRNDPRPRRRAGRDKALGPKIAIALRGDDSARRNHRRLVGPQIEAFLRLRFTNARTEGGNRVVKQLKRVGCGYRNQGNYECRILLHIAAKNAA